MEYAVYAADIIILLILVYFVLRGFRKGLVKTMFGLFTVIIALVLAATFGKTAGEFLRRTDIYENMCINVEESIEEYAQENSHSFFFRNFGEQREKSAIPDALSKYGVDIKGLFEKEVQQDTEKENDESRSLAQRAANSFMTAITNAIGFVAVFLLSLLLLKILRGILDSVAHLPVLSFVNKLGGLAAGIVLGACVVFVLTAITEFILPYLPKNPVLYPGMHKDTVLYSFFVSVNPIFLILFG